MVSRFWEEGKEPFRKTFIKINKCYICNKNSKNINNSNIDTFDGRYNHYGWLYCDSCKVYANLAQYYYYKKIDILPYSSCDNIKEKILKFRRVSSNKKIKPYIESGSLSAKHGNYIIKNGNNILLTIQWFAKFNDYCYFKCIKLKSVIFYNRDIFGYSLNECPIILKYDKWRNEFKKLYKEVNEWCYFLLVSNSKELPYFIEKKIFLYWNDF